MGGAGFTQSYIWMRNAFDNHAEGFVGRPLTAEGFGDEGWEWLPAAAEHAWSYWIPEHPDATHYDYGALNASYGSF